MTGLQKVLQCIAYMAGLKAGRFVMVQSEKKNDLFYFLLLHQMN
jgi:hypothetical protein